MRPSAAVSLPVRAAQCLNKGCDARQTARRMDQNQEKPSKTDRAVKKYYKDLTKSRLLVNDFLEKNGFTAGQPNSKRSSWFCSTYPLNEAVKQGDAYITSELLRFGADPSLKDTWGRSAYDYAARGPPEILQILARHPNERQMDAEGNRWQMHPPPAGYAEFFAKVEQDPLVRVGSCEARWLCILGTRCLRST
ncbi:unnamed protein product [Cladocopium goreaui]|uniref:Mitotic checkpoint protein BUB3.2 n=1 Tax=Cladocopium goreaui TaxID=2562237 RepID=A0A9P1FT71_9DINO|nr:unnamed protein product [Cladocopium goreaui]